MKTIFSKINTSIKRSFAEYLRIVGPTRLIRRYFFLLLFLLLCRYLRFNAFHYKISVFFKLILVICYPFAVTLYDVCKFLITSILYPRSYNIMNQDPYFSPFFILLILQIFWVFVKTNFLLMFSPILAIILFVILNIPKISTKLK